MLFCQRHQTEQLSRLAEKFSEGRVQRAQETDPGGRLGVLQSASSQYWTIKLLLNGFYIP